MKKLLFLLPAMAMMLAGCGAPSEDSSSTSGSSSSTSGSTTTSTSQPNAHAGSVLEFDFTTRNDPFIDGDGYQRAPYLNECTEDGSEVTFFKECAKDTSDELLGLISSVESRTITSGSASGGCYENTKGHLRVGSSKKNGTLSMTFSESIKKVELTCHDYLASGSVYNYVVVNGDKKLAPQNNKTPGVLTFDIEPSEDLLITGANTDEARFGRYFIFNMKLTIA